MVSAPPKARTFTYEEACRLLPEVREITRLAVERMAVITEASDEVCEGDFDSAADAILHEWAAAMSALGLEVKGAWLVDFDSGAGWYCWKWPEEALEFFHGYDEGFAGRIRLQ